MNTNTKQANYNDIVWGILGLMKKLSIFIKNKDLEIRDHFRIMEKNTILF